jgi:hypothetical protein
MTCPRCHSDIETTRSVCPQCGISILHRVSGVMKTSAVMIAAGEESGFYRSVQDVPEPLRTQLLETTCSSNSGTIVIADRAGKEQLTQAMARREAAQLSGSPGSSRAGSRTTPVGEVPVTLAVGPARPKWVAWAGLILVLVLAAVIAAIFYLHW